MEKVIRERLEELRRALEEARRFAVCASGVFGEVTAVLYGSYARGDFNEWSDIDVLVLVREGALPKNPLERLSTVEKCLLQTPLVEPVILTVEEFRALVRKRNPIAEDVARHGIVLVDDLGVGRALKSDT